MSVKRGLCVVVCVCLNLDGSGQLRDHGKVTRPSFPSLLHGGVLVDRSEVRGQSCVNNHRA